MKRIVLLLAAACIILSCLGGCGTSAVVETTAEPAAEPREAKEIIEALITAYGHNGEGAGETVDALLTELNAADPGQGALWTGIMDYWAYVNTEMEIHTDGLPGGLPDGGNLCIVVLGYALNSDGSMREELIGRLNTALSCAAQYPNAYILCTGGGTAGGNPDATEAGRMGGWLLEHGVDTDRLIIEDKSLSTVENAVFSYRILREEYPEVDSVAIVSSSYHIPWGALLFEAAFMKGASEAGAPEIHVISNSAYPITNNLYRESDIRYWQTSGLLQLSR